MASVISELIWRNDLSALKSLLDKVQRKSAEVDYIGSVDDWDNRGNPPLHLALMLGRKEAVGLLLQFGASVLSVNSYNWDALEEAICLGDRDILKDILTRYWKEEFDSLVYRHGPWHKVNTVVPSFYMEIEVKLKSPVPVVSRACPRELIRIWKTRDAVRVDWTISKILGFKIARANMSMIAKIDGDRSTEVIALNHDEKIYERLAPSQSASISHDMIDSFLRDGIVRDEVPLENFTFVRSATKFANMSRNKSTKIHKFDTEVYELDNLSWRQQYRIPIITPTLYEECGNHCRTVPVKQHLEETKLIFSEVNKAKIENLNALQFISESDLLIEENALHEGSAIAKAAYVFREGVPGNLTKEEISEVDKTIDSYLLKASRVAGKHIRSLTRGSTMSRRRSSTFRDDRETINQLAKQIGKATIEEAELIRTHVKTFPTPSFDITAEEYMSSNNERMHLSRECHESFSTYSRNKPISIYMCQKFPINMLDLLPFFEWMTRKCLQPGELKKFLENKAPTGFPVRFKIPIFTMLSLKATVVKFEREATLNPENLAIPTGYKEGEIFPLIEME